MEQQLKEHMRKVHAEFDSGIINNIRIQLLNQDRVETFEDLDDEDILNKFNELAISDAISFADKKDDFVKRKKKTDDPEKEKGLEGHMDWIQSEEAIQRMEEIMRGEFESSRHNLFLERQERDQCLCLCLLSLSFVFVFVIDPA